MDEYIVKVTVDGTDIEFDRRRADSMSFVHKMKNLVKLFDNAGDELPIFDIDDLAEEFFGAEQWERILSEKGDWGIVQGCQFVLEALKAVQAASIEAKNS